ncbi:MAG: MFS transporter [Pirellulales bacterium]
MLAVIEGLTHSDLATGRQERRAPRSERALDATAFCLADVADGLGPFLVIYLTSRRHWTSGEAGFAMSAMLLGTVLSQSFVGAWIDRTHAKRAAIFVGALLVAASTIAMYYLPTLEMIYALQFCTGAVVAVFPPAIAALSLGIVGRARFSVRAGRNEACFHSGNVVSAGFAAVLASRFDSAGVFYGVAFMAVASAVGVLFIRDADVDHDLARGADAADDQSHVSSPKVLLYDRRIVLYAASVVLFHFANAAMLPLLGQKLAESRPDSAQSLMAACIIVAQIAMVPIAVWAGRKATYGRRRVMLLGFAILPLRGVLYTLTDDPVRLIAIQILDGVGAGIFGVVSVLIIADLTQGTGRFNLVLGVVATAVGIGAALSNILTGLIVDAAGYARGSSFFPLWLRPPLSLCITGFRKAC